MSVEYAVLGVAAAKPSVGDQTIEYPVSLGMISPGSFRNETVLINPPENWGLYRPRQPSEGGKSDENLDFVPNFRITGINGRILPIAGYKVDDAADIVLARLKGVPVFCANVDRTRRRLSKVLGELVEQLDLQSLYKTVNQSLGIHAAIATEVALKSSYTLYPANDSDVRWIRELLAKCSFRPTR